VKKAWRPSIEKSAWLMPPQCGASIWYWMRHRVRVAEVEAVARLGDDDGGLAVRREVQVVRIVDRDRLARLAGARVDRRQAAVVAALGVVGGPERAQVPGRHDVLRAATDLEGIDDLQRRRIDHRHRVASQVRHVYAREVVLDRGAQMLGPSVSL
jgi:hypothetical protein